MPVAPASAKSFSFSALTIDLTVARDGSFVVREHRTFDFDGSFGHAFLSIPRGKATLSNFGVSEDDVAYEPGTVGVRTPSTFATKNVGDRVELHWYFEAADEQRTFDIIYRVEGSIVRYRDVAELHWRFIGSEWDVPTAGPVARVTLPGGATRSQIKAWGHGPLDGEVRIVDGQIVEWTVPRLPARRFMEGRLAFPSSLVGLAPQRSGVRLPTIIKEESALADEANRLRRERLEYERQLEEQRRQDAIEEAARRALEQRRRDARIAAQARRAERAARVGVAVTALSLLTFALLFVLYGREHPTPYRGRYLREPPSEDPPAIVGYLVHWGSVTTVDMVATVLDLARRGYVAIEEDRVSDGGIIANASYRTRIMLRRDADERCAPFERTVLELLRDAGAGAERGIPSDELRAWAFTHAEEMREAVRSFTKAVTEAGRGMRLVENRSGVLAANLIAAGIGMAFMLRSVAVRMTVPSSVSGLLIAAGVAALIVQLALTPVLRRRTARGSGLYRAWRAFGRFLSDLSRIEKYRPASVIVWEKYLVYAVPLGVARQVTKAIKLYAPPELQANGFDWYTSSSPEVMFDAFQVGFLASTQDAFAVTPALVAQAAASADGSSHTSWWSSESASVGSWSSGSGDGGGFSGGGSDSGGSDSGGGGDSGGSDGGGGGGAD